MQIILSLLYHNAIEFMIFELRFSVSLHQVPATDQCRARWPRFASKLWPTGKTYVEIFELLIQLDLLLRINSGKLCGMPRSTSMKRISSTSASTLRTRRLQRSNTTTSSAISFRPDRVIINNNSSKVISDF